MKELHDIPVITVRDFARKHAAHRLDEIGDELNQLTIERTQILQLFPDLHNGKGRPPTVITAAKTAQTATKRASVEQQLRDQWQAREQPTQPTKKYKMSAKSRANMARAQQARHAKLRGEPVDRLAGLDPVERKRQRSAERYQRLKALAAQGKPAKTPRKKPHWTQTPEGKERMRQQMLALHAAGLGPHDIAAKKKAAKRGPGRPPKEPAKPAPTTYDARKRSVAAKSGWTPEKRAAMSERLKRQHAIKRKAGLSWAGTSIADARTQLSAQRATRKPRMLNREGQVVHNGETAINRAEMDAAINAGIDGLERYTGNREQDALQFAPMED